MRHDTTQDADERGLNMKDHDKNHVGIVGGVSAAESRGITNKKGGIMAKHKVGKKHHKKGGKKRHK